MRGLLALVVLLACCAPPRARTFAVGLQSPLAPRDEAAARALGLEIVARPADDAAVESAAEGELLSDFARLRFLFARAATRGRAGVVFLLPWPPVGRALVDYPEEWQAVARLSREAAALRPILEAGADRAAAVPAPAGVEVRSWDYRGRTYTVLVNASADPATLNENALEGTRALFEVRADPREDLTPCPAGRCLAPEQALWLEGRYR